MSEGWADDLAELLDAAGRGERRRLAESTALVTALEEIVLGGPRRFTRAEVAERIGVEDAEAAALWRALGFPEVPQDRPFFTDLDVEAASMLGDEVAGLLPPEVQQTVVRSIAQAMSRLADWQVGMLARMVADRADGADGPAGADSAPEQALEYAAGLLPTLEKLQAYIWRRHIAAAVSRFVVAGTEQERELTETRTLAVGFADMVGFTRTTRRRSPAELVEMIERFETSTTEVITEGTGRVVKTVGDEVLFVADDVAAAAELALRLRERVREEPALPRLRIGLAAGEVLQRFGDVYGETVNIAARLTSHARPDTILVDRIVAAALSEDDRFAIQRLKPLQVKGYRHLQPYLLRPAGALRTGTDRTRS